MDLFDPAHEMPTLILYALFHHDRGGQVGEMNLFWVGSEGIYFVNVGSKVITSRKKKIIYFIT